MIKAKPILPVAGTLYITWWAHGLQRRTGALTPPPPPPSAWGFPGTTMNKLLCCALVVSPWSGDAGTGAPGAGGGGASRLPVSRPPWGLMGKKLDLLPLPGQIWGQVGTGDLFQTDCASPRVSLYTGKFLLGLWRRDELWTVFTGMSFIHSIHCLSSSQMVHTIFA